jgi:hypothetical protein
MTRSKITSAHEGRNEVKFEGLNVDQRAASSIGEELQEVRADLWMCS